MSASNVRPITPINRRAARWVTPRTAALGIGLALCATLASAGGTSLCPGSAIKKNLGAWVPSQGVGTLAQDLIPGATLPTPGTNPSLSPDLEGSAVITELIPFDFGTPSGRVKGTLIQKVVNADNATCDAYWRVVLKPGSAAGVRVNALRITKFDHPAAGLVGDFRNDLVPGGIGSVKVKRSSGSGKVITFTFENGVGPGQTSAQLLLDTQIDSAAKNGFVELRTDDGGHSPLISTFVPFQP